MLHNFRFWFYKTKNRAEVKITYKLPTIQEIKEFVRDCHADKSARNDDNVNNKRSKK